jgi:RNA polymerase-binding transcription factor DksA
MVKDGGPERASLGEVRQRLERERDDAISQLKQLRLSPDLDEPSPRTESAAVVEEGDAAQASERRDMTLMSRERLAARVNRLTQALERVARGTYGRCDVCGEEIEPQRLAALPEARTCLTCQQRLEAGVDAA